MNKIRETHEVLKHSKEHINKLTLKRECLKAIVLNNNLEDDRYYKKFLELQDLNLLIIKFELFLKNKVLDETICSQIISFSDSFQMGVC